MYYFIKKTSAVATVIKLDTIGYNCVKDTLQKAVVSQFVTVSINASQDPIKIQKHHSLLWTRAHLWSEESTFQIVFFQKVGCDIFKDYGCQPRAKGFICFEKKKENKGKKKKSSVTELKFRCSSFLFLSSLVQPFSLFVSGSEDKRGSFLQLLGQHKGSP